MIRLSRIFFFLSICILASCNSDQGNLSAEPESNDKISRTYFESMSPDHTGIRFSNTIKENERLHSFIWNFIYQGAGVGLSDINNDGLVDVFFCGNMVSDKLYLNKGNFEFEDISKSSGIDNKLWSTGVNFVDINNDGWTDIYVCKNFFLLQDGVRKNKLYINNGDLTFTEQAEQYGIADAGFSIQSYFFDAENDGDLDMYLVNQPMDQYAAQLARPESLQRLPYSDKLYINQGGVFKDMTEELGLTNKTYGLSAVIADFDDNGFQDIYLCNDYYHGDKFYMNQGNLEFSEQIQSRVNHTSFYSMGSDAADINRDGMMDFFVLDMAFDDHYRSKTNMESMQTERFKQLVEDGHHYQYAVNSLQLNCGDAHFKEIAHFSGVSHTDWSWAPLFVDIDNNSSSDLLISNGILKDLRNNDFVTQLKSNNKFSVNKSNYQQVLSSIPSTPVANKIFINNGEKFEKIESADPFCNPAFSSGLAYADLDNDGDIDLVANNSNSLAGIYRNNTNKSGNYLRVNLKGPDKNKNAIGTQVVLHTDTGLQLKNKQAARGYMSASDDFIHFGMGKESKIDSLVVRWNNIEKSVITDAEINTVLNVDYNKTQKENIASVQQTDPIILPSQLLEYTHQENEYNDYQNQVLLPHNQSQNGPLLLVADLNNDGLQDIHIGSSIGQEALIAYQTSDITFEKEIISSGPLSSSREQIQSIAVDFDKDNDLDLYSVCGGAQYTNGDSMLKDQFYLSNEGNLVESKLTSDESHFNGHCIVDYDFNNDGFPDIIIGGHVNADAYGQNQDTRIFLFNNSSGKFDDATDSYCPQLRNLGMVSSIVKSDIDNDGDIDFILGGDWMPLSFMINSNGSFKIQSFKYDDKPLSGWHWCIKTADFDNDGDNDILIGNLGENNKFKPSKQKPLRLYAGDLDANGDHDVVLAKSYNNTIVPVRGRECSSQEMPFITDKFKDYSSFAAASIDQIYAFDDLDNITETLVNDFSHVYLENKGALKFNLSKLPPQVQMGCIKDFEIMDVNNDGLMDFFYGGNHFPVEPETVRYDAGGLGLCLGKAKGGFEWVDYAKLGIFLNEDIRDLDLIEVNGKLHLLVSINNGQLKSYEINLEKK